MPLDRNKIRRYQEYDKYLSNFYAMYSRQRILDELNETLHKEGFPEVSKSTVNHDISEKGNFVNDMCPAVEVKSYSDSTGTTYYRYAERGFSIWKTDLDSSELAQLQNALLMLKKFKGLPEMDWVEDLLCSLSKRYKFKLPDSDTVIEIEQNLDLEGMTEFFSPILNAILHKQVLKVRYNRSYLAEEEDYIHPYYLKEYNCRWFAICWSEKYQQVKNFAIDRIIDKEDTSKEYRLNDSIDFGTYWDDIVGVSQEPDIPLEKIRLKFTPQRYHYAQTKPLHPSQHNYPESNEITIEVIPNNELIALLLSYGKDVKIVDASDEFRKKMREIVVEMGKNYAECK